MRRETVPQRVQGDGLFDLGHSQAHQSEQNVGSSIDINAPISRQWRIASSKSHVRHREVWFCVNCTEAIKTQT
jgi:hypothetical protein